MNIIGLQYLTFGVEDLAAAHRYLLDYGLDVSEYDPEVGGTYIALDSTGVIVRRSDHSGLPPLPPGACSPCLRETHYGVADDATLVQLYRLLGADREVSVDADGTLHCLDDSGFGIAFQRARRQPIHAPRLGFNVPGQTPGRAPNDCGADPSAVIKPRSLSHVVYFVEDAAKAEALYRRLGFVVTDRLNQLGPFMRPAGTHDHHTLFMLHSHNEHMVGCNHFTFHFGSAGEVLQQGWRFQQKGYQSFWGPGRHLMGSNFFWYFNSPFGAVMEFDADMDHHDDSWVPRALEPGADNSQIFLFEGVDKWAPGE